MAKRKGPTWDEIGENHGKKGNSITQRRYECYYGSSRHGKSTVRIKCPFCDEMNIAYIWSLSGGGKRCEDCGSMFGSHGEAFQYSHKVTEPPHPIGD